MALRNRLSGASFDRILLDAPCSATGVIRRHPDIKWLRQETDIAQLVALQGQILKALWAKLKPNGILLYATCSVLPDENSQQIQHFLARNTRCRINAIAVWTNGKYDWNPILTTREWRGWVLLCKIEKTVSLNEFAFN